MPRLKKSVRKASTRPGEAEQVQERPEGYYCSRCGKHYKRQKGNFPASQSMLYKGNGAYLTVCNHCFESLYDHYREALGNEEDAVKRMCMKFDIYWSPEIFQMVNRTNTSLSRMKSYISKTYLIRYVGKTYDDTLDEIGKTFSMFDLENAALPEELDDAGCNSPIQDSVPTDMPVSPEAILFWGSGFTADAYKELDLRYERWTKDVSKPMQQAQEALYRQICLQEFQINRNIIAGKSIEQGQNVLNNLLGSLNVKPNQLAKDEEGRDLDSTPLGVWAKRWEEQRPIPDDVPDPSIIGYITTWFYGHLGKTFNLKNVYSKMYDAAMNKFRVKMPEFVDENDDELLVDIFGNIDQDDDGGGEQ